MCGPLPNLYVVEIRGPQKQHRILKGFAMSINIERFRFFVEGFTLTSFRVARFRFPELPRVCCGGTRAAKWPCDLCPAPSSA